MSIRHAAFLLLGLAFAAGAPTYAAGPANSPWPMFQHDAQHTGRSPYNGPTRLAEAWRAQLNGVPGGPAIGEDGTIYVPTGASTVDLGQGSLYAINPDGTQKWRFVLPIGPPNNAGGCRQIAAHATPAIADDGTIYVHTQSGYTGNGAFCTAGPSHVYAVNPNGTEKWHHQLNLGAAVFSGGTLSSPVIASDGTILVGSKDTAVYALDPTDGSEVWVDSPIATSISSSPALGADGSVYVSIFDLYAYESDGTPKWAAEVGDGAPNDASPSVGSTGRIYGCFLNPDKCHAVTDGTTTGTSDWNATLTAGPTTPAIRTDGTILLATGSAQNDGRLLALNPDGSELWHLNSPLDPLDTPIVDAGGRAYVRVDIDFGPQGFADALLVIGPNGAELDRRLVPEAGDIGDVASAIGSDGTLYAPLPHKSFGYDPTDNYLAAFVQGARLEVDVTGDGSGTVTGPGIDCTGSSSSSDDCTETYVKGETVTLSAAPSGAGDAFGGWDRDCGGTGSCVLTMDADRSVGARFAFVTPPPPAGPLPTPPPTFPFLPPPGTTPNPLPNGTTTPGSFAARTRVTLALGAPRIPAGGPLPVRVVNGNPFPVTGRLSGETATAIVAQRRRRVRLRPRSFAVAANGRRTVRLALPAVLRARLARTGVLALRLRATLRDPAGNRRSIARRVIVRRRSG